MASEFDPRKSDNGEDWFSSGTWVGASSSVNVAGGSALASNFEDLWNTVAVTPMRIAALAYCLTVWRIGFECLLWGEEEAVTLRGLMECGGAKRTREDWVGLVGVSLNWKRDEEEDDDEARAEEFMVELERLSRETLWGFRE